MEFYSDIKFYIMLKLNKTQIEKIKNQTKNLE